MDYERMYKTAHESRSLAELERSLESEGIRYKEQKDLFKQLYIAGYHVNKGRLDEILSRPPAYPDKLPGTEVKKDGVVYKIHGIVHGPINGKHRMSDNVKHFIESKLAEEETPMVVEDGLEKLLNLRDIPYVSIADSIMWAKDQVGAKELTKFLFKDMVARMAVQITGGYMLELSKINGITNKILDIYNMALQDAGYILTEREFTTTMENYASADVKLDMLKDPRNIDTMEKNFLWRMSERMADIMEVYGVENSEVRAVVGRGHELQIAYIIQNGVPWARR